MFLLQDSCQTQRTPATFNASRRGAAGAHAYLRKSLRKTGTLAGRISKTETWRKIYFLRVCQRRIIVVNDGHIVGCEFVEKRLWQWVLRCFIGKQIGRSVAGVINQKVSLPTIQLVWRMQTSYVFSFKAARLCRQIAPDGTNLCIAVVHHEATRLPVWAHRLLERPQEAGNNTGSLPRSAHHAPGCWPSLAMLVHDYRSQQRELQSEPGHVSDCCGFGWLNLFVQCKWKRRRTQNSEGQELPGRQSPGVH